MFVYLLLIGSALCAPSDEFRGILGDGEITFNDEAHKVGIVPSGYSPHKFQKKINLKPPEFIDKNSNVYKQFAQFMENGSTMKGLTFNIYDDDMRDSAILLHHILKDIKSENLQNFTGWAIENINFDMYTYAWHLTSLYNQKNNNKELLPPFILKPNYFLNAETIRKASQLKINNGNFNLQEAKVHQFYRIGDTISINTNYSGWNLPQNGCEGEINYFREDIGLNSYYYGIHLMHPFWMSNEELDQMSPRHAEYYYYRHQQLVTRYLLEKKHLKIENSSALESCRSYFNPYLVHDNGLSFPVRSSVKGEWNDNKAILKSIDIAIKECISRGILIMFDGKAINLTEDNYVELLAKLIRANLDGIRTSKLVRSIYGYGGNGYPINEYNPAPSVLHFPETSLRDPGYWYLIEYMLHYFTEYQRSLDAYDFSQFETEDFNIVDANSSKITTYFDYYQFNINRVFETDYFSYIKSPLVITARQKRLNHLPFTVNFNVKAKHDIDGVVRLFLGPQCTRENCWDNYSKFFELDSYIYNFKEGLNKVQWTPDSSNRFSFDDVYNLESPTIKQYKFSLFKFPKTLLIPKGLTEGLNLTLFVIITPADPSEITESNAENEYHKSVCADVDDKPLGFPFHRQTVQRDISGINFKFFNVTIYHKKQPHESKGYFSPHLL